MPALFSQGLAVLVNNSLCEEYKQHRFKVRLEVNQNRIESSISNYLRNQTLTFGANDPVEMKKSFSIGPSTENKIKPQASRWWCDHSAPSYRLTSKFSTFKTRSTADLEDNYLVL